MSKEITSQRIEELYDAYMAGDKSVENDLYQSVRAYCQITIGMTLGMNRKTDVIEEVSQELMLFLASGGIERHTKGKATFATFCSNVAKNKTIDWLRKKKNIDKNEAAFSEDREKDEDDKQNGYLVFGSTLSNGNTPETDLLKNERQQEIYSILQQVICRIISDGKKPYNTVAVCYSSLLFTLQHPDSKELSSALWAFNEMKDETIEFSADRFIKELNRAIPGQNYCWSDEFDENMENEYKDTGKYIFELIFGEHFTKKDIENWTLRSRKKIRNEIAEEVIDKVL